MTEQEDVVVRWCDYNGTLINESVQRRNVYRPKTRPAYINSLGGKKFLASDNPPLVIYKPLSPPMDCSFQTQILDKLSALPPGSQVRVVPLP